MKLYFEAFNRKGKSSKSQQLKASAKPGRDGRVLPWEAKSVYRSRKDIKNWNEAQDMFHNAEFPKSWPLMQLLDEILLDAHLTSQIENRKQQIFSLDYNLKNEKGETDEEQTKIFKTLGCFRPITNEMLNSGYYGNSLIELDRTAENGADKLSVINIPRTNIIPAKGIFYKDFTDETNPILYREMKEYGTWLLEFNSGGLGLLNKAVPHVLFKRFAQSCWSELCEIYGIPPRVMKTNTYDSTMLSRAEQMMQDMGAAAWFIIDETEEFEFAQGVSTNGDVYKNLMTVCRNEISLLISGAVIGQDTENGNYSKEKSAQDILWNLVQSDMALCEDYWNKLVLPALARIGLLKPGLRLEFEAAEDLDQLFKFTTGLMPFKEVDNDWLKEKFGVEITGDKIQPPNPFGNQNAANDFFV